MYVNDKENFTEEKKTKEEKNHNNWVENVMGHGTIVEDNRNNLKNSFHQKGFLWKIVFSADPAQIPGSFFGLCVLCK